MLQYYLSVLNLKFVSPDSLLLVLLLPVDHPLPTLLPKLVG